MPSLKSNPSPGGDGGGVALSCTRKLFTRFYTYIFKKAFRSDFTVNRCLLSLLERKVPPSVTPFRGVSSSDFTINNNHIVAYSPHLWIRVYTPEIVTADDVVRFPVVVFFHGGGFVYGSPDYSAIDSFSRDFARELGSIVISVNYRLAPEDRFPSQYEDGFNILKVIDEGLIPPEVIPLNADLNRCFLAGESAGGNIAHHVTVRASEYDQFKRLKIVGLIAIQPFFGGEERTESELRFGKTDSGLSIETSDWYWKAFLPVGSNRDHEAANVVRSKTVALHFPATILFIGGVDPLKDRNREYGEWLKKSGVVKELEMVEYPEAPHGFSWFSDLPEYSMLLRRATEFINKAQESI